MMNPKPIGVRRTVQFMVLLTILAWATQTLFQQWGYGGLILPQGGTSAAAPVVPPAITLEVRERIGAGNGTVTLRDVCRWSEQDAPVMDPVADTVLARLGDASGVRQVSIVDIRNALHDVGVNLSTLQFSGSASCSIVSAEAGESDLPRVVRDGEDSTEVAAPATQPSHDAPEPLVADVPQMPLRQLLADDLSNRLGLPAERLKLEFSWRDEPLLRLTSPRCTFAINADQAGTLGEVAWTVTIRTDSSERQVAVSAKARATEDQLVTTRSLSRGQAILERDVVARQVLVDQLTPEPITDPAQVVGQVAARELKGGDVLNAGDVKSVPLVTAGEFMTVALKIGPTDVETVARAMDTGGTGEIVRAKNPATGDVYHVIITGPNAGQSQPANTAADVAAINPAAGS